MTDKLLEYEIVAYFATFLGVAASIFFILVIN